MTSAVSAQPPKELRVLTLNTWMLKLPMGLGVAKDIPERLARMPDEIAATHADLIGLQEVWDPKIRAELVAALALRGYPHHAYLENNPFSLLRGLIGNGLLVVSKFPIRPSTHQLVFADYTRTDEYFAMKGAILVQVEIPGVGLVDFYNAHLGAVSFNEKRRLYDADHVRARYRQFEELVAWIGRTKGKGIVFLAADLNTHFQDWTGEGFGEALSPEYQMLLAAGFHNPMERREWTYDMRNPYASEGVFKNLPSEVEDYVFVSGMAKISAESQVVFREKPISDHYGVLTRFTIP
ncbi:MAG: endonuclease/exonuclease/phosphatase family protein [Bdellovibrionota bacterium]